MANNYKTLQSQVETDVKQWQDTYEAERDKANAAAVKPATPTGPETYSQYERQQSDGTWSQATQRPVASGTSGADEQFLSDQSYAIIQDAKKNYGLATTDEERAYWHNVAEAERARAGYSGGTDGSMYITGLDYLPQNQGGYGDEHGGNPSGSTGAGGSQSDLKGLLDQWQQAALQQQNSKIDYAVAKAVADLERALADAQPQFKEAAENVAREERQALDNSALYAEARGDKGGIGQSQYNEIQAAAAQNHLAVQQAQTKLATDTARQIADLRAQGEFQKADAALEIAQTYLSQLISLEQWAAEFGLSQAQFQESIRQWEAEFNLAMQKFQVDTDLAYGSQLADMGAAMLQAGIPLTQEQMKAMGITAEQANQYLMGMQLQGSGGGGGSQRSESYSTVSKKAAKYPTAEEALAYLNNMVTVGAISEDEKNYIYQVELGGTYDGGPGMDLARFRAAESVLEMQLSSGLTENAQSHVNAIWSELNNQQKNALRELFAVYGYSAEEE